MSELGAAAGVLFDLDGTLVDTAGDLAAAMNHALVACGAEGVPSEAVRHLVGHGARAMLARGFELSTGTPAADSLLDDGLALFLDYYSQHIADFSVPFEGVIDLVQSLRNGGVAVGICTNKREATARLLLEALEIDHLFGAIVGGDTAEAAKPDPRPVLLCLQGIGVVQPGAQTAEGQRAILIGDSDTDILAAEAAGMASLIVTFGYGPLKHRQKAAGEISHYKDAHAMVLKALGASR